MNNKKRKPGFTLVEIVIVVTVLGILSSLGFSKFGNVQENAKTNADYVAASSLATATNLAIVDKKVKPNDKDEINIDDLLKEGYLSMLPKPQSREGSFEIKIEDKSNVVVSIKENEKNSVVIYPKTS